MELLYNYFTPLPIVFIENYRNRDYYEACKATAPKHFKFLPSMPAKSELLRSVIQNCHLFFEVPLDHPGLSALEAGLAGATLVLQTKFFIAKVF